MFSRRWSSGDVCNRRPPRSSVLPAPALRRFLRVIRQFGFNPAFDNGMTDAFWPSPAKPALTTRITNATATIRSLLQASAAHQSQVRGVAECRSAAGRRRGLHSGRQAVLLRHYSRNAFRGRDGHCRHGGTTRTRGRCCLDSPVISKPSTGERPRLTQTALQECIPILKRRQLQ